MLLNIAKHEYNAMKHKKNVLQLTMTKNIQNLIKLLQDIKMKIRDHEEFSEEISHMIIQLNALSNIQQPDNDELINIALRTEQIVNHYCDQFYDILTNLNYYTHDLTVCKSMINFCDQLKICGV